MLTISSAAFDAGRVTVAWSDPQPVAGTSQYIVTVYCDAVPYFGNNSPPVAVGQPMTVMFDPGQPDPISQANSYCLEAASYDGDGNVLARSGRVTLLTSPPINLRPRLEGACLAVQWTAVAEGGVTGYSAQLLQDGQQVESQEPSVPEVTFSTALQAQSTYAVRVRTRGDQSSGPCSELLYAPLVLASAECDGSQVTVTWSDPQPVPGASQYIVTVYCDSIPYFGNNSPPVAVGQPMTVTFDPGQPEPIDESNSYYLQAASYDADGNLLAKSGQVALLAWPPVGEDLYFDGVALSCAWTDLSLPGVTGYTVQLLKDGSPVESLDVSGTPAPFQSPFEAGATYEARIRPVGTNTQGPWSADALGPTKSAITYGFDDLGRLHQLIGDGKVNIVYVYDDRGNVLTETITLGT